VLHRVFYDDDAGTMYLDFNPTLVTGHPGGTTADLMAQVKRTAPATKAVHHAPGDERFFEALNAEVRRGDLVAFVGAGDIDRKARAWLATRVAAASRGSVWNLRMSSRGSMGPIGRSARSMPGKRSPVSTNSLWS
jgi:hypothetical protein